MLQTIFELTIIANKFSSYIFCKKNSCISYTKTNQTHVHYYLLSYFTDFRKIFCAQNKLSYMIILTYKCNHVVWLVQSFRDDLQNDESSKFKCLLILNLKNYVPLNLVAKMCGPKGNFEF